MVPSFSMQIAVFQFYAHTGIHSTVQQRVHWLLPPSTHSTLQATKIIKATKKNPTNQKIKNIIKITWIVKEKIAQVFV